jgi:hypothetical protein
LGRHEKVAARQIGFIFARRFFRQGMGGLAQSGFRMGRGFLVDIPTKSDPALLLISIFTHTGVLSDFSFASMFAGTGRESAASRQRRHAREGATLCCLLCFQMIPV